MATPHTSRTTTAGAEHDRELVVLGDGPWARRWYWREDLEAMQVASRHVGHPDTHSAGELRRYRPTDTHEPHPHNIERSGRVYRFGPAQDTPREAQTASRVVAQVAEQVVWAGAVVTAASKQASGGRVLVTGSRTWTDRDAIRDGLAAVWGDGDRVLVTGACPTGADALAEECWRSWGGQVETHPADWDTHGRAAGPRRNTAMVAAGAQVCVAFIRDNSRGASHLAGLADAAGIPVHRHDDTHPSATGAVEQAHRAVATVPAPRQALDDETADREQQRRVQHEQHDPESAGHGAEREGVLW